MSNTGDFTGHRFGRWTVLGLSDKRTDGERWWRVRCDCGGESTVRGVVLYRGSSKSCGCLRRERVSQRQTTHGRSRSAEHVSWKSMLMRCLNPSSPDFQNYGGRGIAVCERWRSFELFLADMGERPAGYSLERIDVNGDYEPNNVRWATCAEQAVNRRNNIRYEIDGRQLTAREIADLYKVPLARLSKRLRLGWSASRAVNEPVDQKRQRASRAAFTPSKGGI
jgi:hypothetical protein